MIGRRERSAEEQVRIYHSNISEHFMNINMSMNISEHFMNMNMSMTITEHFRRGWKSWGTESPTLEIGNSEESHFLSYQRFD